jgi:hypothetical protein
VIYYGVVAPKPDIIQPMPTHSPPMLLISIDGFRADYFSYGLNPWLSKFGKVFCLRLNLFQTHPPFTIKAAEGTKADYMIPSYPVSLSTINLGQKKC